MQIVLKTLTPLWTGGIERICDRVHETSIIGSLRWWYEAIIRGLGGSACDPSSEKRCPQKSDESGKKVHCIACDLFGCTDWQRRFRLRLNDGQMVYPQQNVNELINIRPTGRSRGWYYGAGQRSINDSILGQIKLLRGDTINITQQTAVPLLLASKWGALGAKIQHGFGVVQATLSENGIQIQTDLKEFFNYIEQKKVECRQSPTSSNMPKFNEFFFSKFRFILTGNWWEKVDGLNDTMKLRKNNEHNQIKKKQIQDEINRLDQWISTNGYSVPIAPSVKNQLYLNPKTNYLSTLKSNNQVVDLFGTAKRNYKKAARINISSAYQCSENLWETRVWGWVPGDITQRGQVMNEIYSALTSNAFWGIVLGNSSIIIDSYEWRELRSSHCHPPCIKQCNNTEQFIQCLIGGKS